MQTTRSDMRMLDDKAVVGLLRSAVDRAGGQSAWARKERIDRTLLNRVLRGRKQPTGKIIRALKLCNAYALRGDGAA
jgi:DNA-binding phage protein